MKIKKMLILILTVCTSLSITGCWDMLEVDKIAIVAALGIDKIPGPEPFLLTAQIINPTTMKKGMGGGNEKPFLTASIKGKTLYGAILKFSKNSPRKFFFSHLAIIVLGENAAKSGIRPTLDFFARDREFRRTIWLLETPKTAQEILHASLQLEKIPAIGIQYIIVESKQYSITELVQRKDFIRDLTSKSHAAILSKLDLIPQQTIETTRKKEATINETTQREGGETGRNLQLSGEAVFNKDKLVGYLTNTETRGLLWILGKIQGGPLIIHCPVHPNEKIVLECKSKHTQIIPSFKNGKLNISIHIQCNGQFKELNCHILDISNANTFRTLETLANEQIKTEIQKSIQKAQHLKTDIFGFGNQIYRNQPNIWKHIENNWDQQFQQMKVDVSVSSTITQLGVITRPIQIEENSKEE